MAELFKNTHEAITFALRFSSEQYAESPMSKLIGGTVGSGKGLVGNDGAGQAGLILAALQMMDPMHQHCITARYSPKYTKCGCCGGDKPLPQWQAAITALQEWSLRTFSGLSHATVREAIVLNFYDRGVSITHAAARSNVPAKTAYNQRAKIHAALVKLDQAAQQDMANLFEGKALFFENNS